MAYAFVGVGVLLLFAGSEALLRAGIGLFRALGLSPLLIGLLIVSATTSAPELAVALQAAARNTPDIAVGNVIGSNIINMLLILGLCALLRPLPSPPKVTFRDGGTLFAASAALALIVIGGTFTRQIGLFLLAALVVYIAASFATDWRRSSYPSTSEARAQCRDVNRSPVVNLLLMVFAAIALYFGARCLLDGSIAVETQFHLSDAMVGLTLIALATSLPELIVTLILLSRGFTEITAGHLLASSIFNILAVLGITAAIYPFAMSHSFSSLDVYVMVGVAVAIMPLMITSWRLSRANGVLMLAGYAAYAVFLACRLGFLSIAVLHLG